MRRITFPCPGCRHTTPAKGTRLHGSTMLTCPLCGRDFPVTDEEMAKEHPGARFAAGEWMASKVS